MGASPLGLCCKPIGCMGLCSMLGGVSGRASCRFSSVVGGLVCFCGQMYVLIVFVMVLRVGLMGHAVAEVNRERNSLENVHCESFFYMLRPSIVAIDPQYLLSAVAETETNIPHGDPIGSSLSWTTPFQAMEPVTEITPEGVFTFPHSHSHRSFKEYVGNQSTLGRAVIPAAILAGYTGT